jgi:hypothetical protein
LNESNACSGKPGELGVDIFDEELCGRDSVRLDRRFEGLGRRMLIGFKQEFHAIRLPFCGDREPAVLTNPDIPFLLESEDTGVEFGCL